MEARREATGGYVGCRGDCVGDGVGDRGSAVRESEGKLTGPAKHASVQQARPADGLQVSSRASALAFSGFVFLLWATVTLGRACPRADWLT